MNDTTPELDGARSARDWAKRAEHCLDRLYVAIDEAADLLESHQELDPTVRKKLEEMRGLQTTVIKEGARLNEFSRTLDGAVEGRALDLDGARSEIECRLACLRDATGAE